jgi:hypothetical protein
MEDRRRDGELRGTGVFLKGEMHCHPLGHPATLGEDVRTVLDWYRQRGYQYIVLTAHRKLVPTAGLSDDTLLVLPGMEMNCADDVVGDFHMLGLGLSRLAEQPQSFTAQEAIDLIRADGGMAFMAHPSYFDQSVEALLTLDGLSGIEIYNRNVAYKLGKGLATETWNQLLSRGRRLWGLANTDNHFPRGLVDGQSIGWNVVEVAQRTPEAVLDSIRHGRFYCSTRPEITAFYVEGRDLIVRCSPAKHVYIVANRNMGSGFHAEGDGYLTELSYPLGSRKGPEQWVRVEVVDEHGGVAWSNPLCPHPHPAAAV